jgi:hypothetical protein
LNARRLLLDNKRDNKRDKRDDESNQMHGAASDNDDNSNQMGGQALTARVGCASDERTNRMHGLDCVAVAESRRDEDESSRRDVRTTRMPRLRRRRRIKCLDPFDLPNRPNRPTRTDNQQLTIDNRQPTDSEQLASERAMLRPRPYTKPTDPYRQSTTNNRQPTDFEQLARIECLD